MDLGADEWTTFRKVTFPLIFPGILAAGLLAFALSIDDFVITQFTAGQTTTFPLWVYGASRIGVPPQVNVMGTLIFLIAMVGIVLWVVLQRRDMTAAADVAGGADVPHRRGRHAASESRPPRCGCGSDRAWCGRDGRMAATASTPMPTSSTCAASDACGAWIASMRRASVGCSVRRSRARTATAMSTGACFAGLRARHGLSLREASRRSGVSVSFLSALERGVSGASVATLQRLTSAYGTNMLGLFGGPASGVGGHLVRADERDVPRARGRRGAHRAARPRCDAARAAALRARRVAPRARAPTPTRARNSSTCSPVP